MSKIASQTGHLEVGFSCDGIMVFLKLSLAPLAVWPDGECLKLSSPSADASRDGQTPASATLGRTYSCAVPRARPLESLHHGDGVVAFERSTGLAISSMPDLTNRAALETHMATKARVRMRCCHVAIRALA
jgi:hypothetical protein